MTKAKTQIVTKLNQPKKSKTKIATTNNSKNSNCGKTQKLKF